jgi:hypothetical protein
MHFQPSAPWVFLALHHAFVAHPTFAILAIMIETLWRGASTIGLRNLTRHFRSCGIWTKQADGGDPAYITRAGVLAAVSAHVVPTTLEERAFMERSCFASFSESRVRAFHYASGREARPLVSSGPFDHEAVVFRIDISNHNQGNAPGLYGLEYQCDDSLREPDFQEDVRLLRDTGYLAGGCEFCESGPRPHSLLLINVVEFLQHHISYERGQRALEKATADLEWLLLPTDHVKRLHGDASHIPRSSIWTYETFRFSEVASNQKAESQ